MNDATNALDATIALENTAIQNTAETNGPVDAAAIKIAANGVVDIVPLDYNQEQESDARHEPPPPSKQLIDAAYALSSPPATPQPEPASIPNGTLHEEPQQDITMLDATKEQPIEQPHTEQPVAQVPEQVAKQEEPASQIPEQPATQILEQPATQLPEQPATQLLEQPVMQPIAVLTNGHDLDIKMDESSSPMDYPPGSSNSTSHTTPNEYTVAEDEHPAKRARKHSDADQASFAHSATPPPESNVSSFVSAAPTIDSAMDTSSASAVPRPPTLDPQQYRFCLATLRNLKKMKEAGPFLRPVDAVALNIPHYPVVIKTPMDFSTVERKIGASNPTKRDPNSQIPHYDHIEEFTEDIRLIFNNCFTFNGPDHVVTAMSRKLSETFEKQMKNMPITQEVKPIPKKMATPPPLPQAIVPKKAQPARRASMSVPTIRRSDMETIGRPKREIHPPPPKDLSYGDAPKKTRRMKRPQDDGIAEQLKFCGRVIDHLVKKQYFSIANAFYEPVDYVKLGIPTYPKIVKKPMDLLTMRNKLENGEYTSAQKFHDDFKLMIRNCFNFNPPGTPVNSAGIELQRVFDEKWKSLPLIREHSDEEDSDEEQHESDEDRTRQIALMESQIEQIQNNLATLKNPTKPAPKPKKKEREKAPAREKVPVASTSKPATAKQPKASSSKKKSTTTKKIADDDTLTFEQKKDLSESIGKLDESKLEKVINIIHEGVPEIRDSTEEIELEIDTLPPAVLTKLYNFVLRPQRAPATKRVRPGRGGTGTGGLKRKSMDEDAEAEKIRQLEERMALFENGGASAAGASKFPDQSSDSSSGTDSSGSDSE